MFRRAGVPLRSDVLREAVLRRSGVHAFRSDDAVLDGEKPRGPDSVDVRGGQGFCFGEVVGVNSGHRELRRPRLRVCARMRPNVAQLELPRPAQRALVVDMT